MANLSNVTPQTVKRSSMAIILNSHTPQPRHCYLRIGLSPIHKPQSTPTVKAHTDAQAHLGPQPTTEPVTTPIQTPPLGAIQLLTDETSSVRALCAELMILTTALRPLAEGLQMSTVKAVYPKPTRNYTPRKTDQQVDPIPLQDRKLISFKQAAAIYPKSEQAFRHIARQAEQYKKYPKANIPANGFEKCIVRQMGSRNIYLNAEALEIWMTCGQGGER